MTVKEKLQMHDQIVKENQKKEEIFREEEAERKLADAFGLVYKADNMNRTFRHGDKLYLVRKQYSFKGDIVVIRLQDPDRFHVCFMYPNEGGGYTLTDEKNPPLILDDIDYVGTVIGYERIF
jgi:SOS-response transcriptional repressor LexA